MIVILKIKNIRIVIHDKLYDTYTLGGVRANV